jgi:heme a synthase
MSSTAIPNVAASRADEAQLPAKRARILRLWLGSIAVLIVAMILVGGATRLTDSGLSITEWQPIVGAVPPLSESAWQKAFEAYQKIPEYLELKRGMSLDAFKTIYWWEWAHRFLGRLIGFVFLAPFIGFWLAGFIPRALLPRLLGLFLLGGIQGAVGWYMVKSGLSGRVDVSQYRLAAHLGIAVLILGYTLWLLFGLGAEERPRQNPRTRPAVSIAAAAVLGLIYLQILAGALVAGLDAGMGYNTWPLINGAFVPEGLGALSPPYLNLFENPLTVQFDHRLLGYAVVLATLGQAAWLAAAARSKSSALIGSALTLACLVLLQATLGVWTLLLAVPLPLGLAHQAGALAVFAAALYYLWLATQGAEVERAAQLAASA